MTKQVRIENADCSPVKIRIVEEFKNSMGDWVANNPEGFILKYPFELIPGTVYKGKRLIITEVEE